MSALAPPGPASKPVPSCINCHGTEFAPGRESFNEIPFLLITSGEQAADVKYFHPQSFSVSAGVGSHEFVVNLFQNRQQEEDLHRFHMLNSPNYEYVRKNYKVVNEKEKPCVFNRVTPVEVVNVCVKCYNRRCKECEAAVIEKKLLQVVAQPLFFCWCYLPKPFGTQHRFSAIENDREDAGVCWHCDKCIKDNEMYVGSEVHPNAVLCMDGFKDYHCKLHTKKSS